MKKSEFDWMSKDGLKIYAQGWEPDFGLEAVVCLVHGIGEHSSRYSHVANYLVNKGYAVLAFDLRGHGRSEGQRGHTRTYDALMDDIACFLDKVQDRFPRSLRFLYGHSLGGNLVINYALRSKPLLAGVIATAPELRLAFEPPPVKVALGRIMNTIYPAFSQASGLDTRTLSRDVSVIQAYENDPLVHDRVSARLFIGFYEAGLWAIAHAEEFQLPLLLMHGSADRLTSVDASREFAAKAGRTCTLKIWDGCYHEIHNDLDKDEVFKFLVNWLDQQKRN